MPAADTAAQYRYTPDEQSFVDTWLTAVIHGAPDTIRAGLTDLQRRTQADELMLTTMIHDFLARERSYALVAEEFDLSSDGS
ncbi:hypothetical protein ITP53_05675 [Nonomuraea sp. K274]|uniref:Uncharacterized protein n=1 Tax=Nonomuraea cypriaca TaxID=1187855 RepID=A0A931A4Z7_9ACTN|nr:hypothetical protein [Nonomuraea cypriaca]MBF8185233.1 hypothetical protein [Nonomuraea cypriaca]